MRITESCAACLYDKQQHRTDDPVYLARVRELIDNRREEDTSPYLVYQVKLTRLKSRASNSVLRTEPALDGRSSSPEYSRSS